MTYQVLAPLVIAKDQDGASHHVYRDGVIQWLSDEQREHFLSTGLVEEIGGQAAADPDADVDGPPSRGASQADWAAYAVSKGWDPDEAAATKRADLIEAVG